MSSQFPFFSSSQGTTQKDKNSKKLYDKLLPIITAGNVAETRKWLETNGDVLNSYHAFKLFSIAINAHNHIMVACLCDYIKIEALHSHHGNILIVAIKTNDESMVRLLLTQGASLFLKHRYAGPAAKCAAIDTCNKNILKVLSDFGSSFEPREGYDKQGKRYIYSQTSTAAVLTGDKEIMKYLLDHGADINAVDYHSGTPLYIAVQNNKRDMAEFLIQNGAEINNMSGYAGSPLHIAAERGHMDMVDLLLANGANVNLENEKGQTPLHIAVEENYLDIVQVLLEHGAHLHAEDNKGKTPGDLAQGEAMRALLQQALNNGITQKPGLKI